MGTRRSRHNKGRKPLYKDHRSVASNILEHKKYGGMWYDARSWWTPPDIFALGVLCDAEADVDGSADALGRPPKSLVYKARELGLTVPIEWGRLLYKKRPTKIRQPQTALVYPYIVKARDEHADLLTVNAMIPKGISDHMRADICQEILLAIYEGRTTLDDLRARKGTEVYYIRHFYKQNYECGGYAISFQNTDEDWNSDRIASQISAKEWKQNQMADRRNSYDNLAQTYTPAVQIEAVWQDQVGRHRLKLNEIGMFLTHDEVEELLEEQS